MSLNLASIVEYSVRYFRDEVALIHDDRRLDYREFRRRVVAFAAHLRGLGIQRGDNVALLSTNRMSFTIAYFGILYAGAAVVPISFLSVGREVAYSLRDSDAVALVAWSELADAAREGFGQVDGCRHLFLFDESGGPLTPVDGPAIDPDGDCDIAPTRPDDTAVILYTSGTTGEPKGAELTHFNMYSNAQYSSERLLGAPGGFEPMGPGHVAVCALPLFHSFGQTCNQNASLFGGGAVTYMERFDARSALEVMERDRVTLFAGVPTMYFQLLEHEDASGFDLTALKHCCSGGAAMPVEVMREFEQRYPVKILEGYGLSETSPVATFNAIWKERKLGSIGEPIYGCDVKIFDDQNRELGPEEVGEIVIRGYNVMKGYYQRPDATAEAFRSGWFHSGDMGKKDADGYIYIVDRKKDMIIRGGFNVYPREVEEILYAHPSVLEAAVVGVPDEKYGEEIKAYVALRKVEGEAAPTAEDIRDFCKSQLSATKYPRLVEILPELPKGPTGKILRKDLRSRNA
ncbi:MAG: long-chain fatty acid--CoA ligase [Planctomycetota bacterium]|nr:long-chain fatty acid--CoA ligase [Planctomycetota bacterium]